MPQSRSRKNAATHLELLYADHDRDEISNEDSAMLVALMSIENVEIPPAQQLEFLGG